MSRSTYYAGNAKTCSSDVDLLKLKVYTQISVTLCNRDEAAIKI